MAVKLLLHMMIGKHYLYKKATGGVEKYQYDNLNRVIKTVDGNGNETSYQYDVADRIVSVKMLMEIHVHTSIIKMEI